MIIDSSPLIAGSVVVGIGSHGVLAENIPSNGINGPGYVYEDLDLPADNGKEIRGLIVTTPASGDFFAYEDTSFTFENAADGAYNFTYQLYVDGVLTGSVATVTLVVGVVSAFNPSWAMSSRRSNTIGAM